MEKHFAVSTTLKELGVTPGIQGYDYCRAAIELVLEDTAYLRGITKVLYPKIAKQFKSTPTRVERAIRHAIEKAFYNGNIDTHHTIFSYSISAERGKPTNSEFIATVADYINLTCN